MLAKIFIRMRRAYKFRIYPNKEQAQNLERSLDLCRFLYNAAIQERRGAWKLNRVSISYFDQTAQIKDIRANDPDYLTVQSRVLHQTLRQVDKAFKAFFRRCKAGEKAGFPRFKSKAFFNSFFYNTTGFKFIDGKLRLAHIGILKIKQHRDIEGTIKEVTVKRDGSKWFAIVSCADVPAKPRPATNQTVGIDVGIENFATLSDGTQIDNWKYYASSAKQLRIAQRRVARRKKGSNRRHKAVAILRTIHRKIFNQRHDFQHKLSTHLIANYDLIVVENLNIKGMSKGILSKQILDVSWSSFFQKLTYKAENAGKQLVKVKPHFTSQDCSQCGNRVKKELSVRVHHCSNCGLSLHRDHNAAINILAAGLAVQDLTWATEPCVS